MKIGGDDRTDPHEPQAGNDTETDRTAADHQRRILLRRAAAACVLESDRERLGHRRHVIFEARRDLHQRILVEKHELSPAARALVAEADHGMPAGVAHHRHRRDPASGFHGALTAGPIVDDFADVFVTGYEGTLEGEPRVRTTMLTRELDDIPAGLKKVLF